MAEIPAPSTPENDYGFKGSPMGGWLVIFIAMYIISAAQGVLGLYPAFLAALSTSLCAVTISPRFTASR